MTKADRVALREQQLQDKLALANRQLVQFHAKRRTASRADLNKRRYQVGALADEAGLFGWSNAELAEMFRVLACLRDASDPVAALERLLGEVVGTSCR
jgi:hypothetical protein